MGQFGEAESKSSVFSGADFAKFEETEAESVGHICELVEEGCLVVGRREFLGQ